MVTLLTHCFVHGGSFWADCNRYSETSWGWDGITIILNFTLSKQNLINCGKEVENKQLRIWLISHAAMISHGTWQCPLLILQANGRNHAGEWRIYQTRRSTRSYKRQEKCDLTNRQWPHNTWKWDESIRRHSPVKHDSKHLLLGVTRDYTWSCASELQWERDKG